MKITKNEKYDAVDITMDSGIDISLQQVSESILFTVYPVNYPKRVKNVKLTVFEETQEITIRKHTGFKDNEGKPIVKEFTLKID